jgi:predicted dehydrogenase
VECRLFLPNYLMLRIAIVGCGKIADQHVDAMQRIAQCTLVAVCDRELLMARQLAERYRVPECFSDLGEMLRTAKPQIVHITTPPQSHFALAKQCLDGGCHVYLEKPFTITAAEAQTLLADAEAKGLKVTAGHNYQFTLEMMEMRRLVGEGFLGGKPVHLESHWSYDLGDVNYVGPVLGNRNHWVRQLPGQLFHNIISHGIAKLAEFLDDNIVEVRADAHQSEGLRRMGGADVMDELRVLIRDRAGTTGFFCFSTQFRPGLNELRVFGPSNSMVADINTGSLVRSFGRSDKSYLTYFLPPWRLGREHFRNARRNVINFIRGRLHQDFGMKELIERFYNSVEGSAPLPIPYREILLTARIMDAIFVQIYDRAEAGMSEEGVAKQPATIGC